MYKLPNTVLVAYLCHSSFGPFWNISRIFNAMDIPNILQNGPTAVKEIGHVTEYAFKLQNGSFLFPLSFWAILKAYPVTWPISVSSFVPFWNISKFQFYANFKCNFKLIMAILLTDFSGRLKMGHYFKK